MKEQGKELRTGNRWIDHGLTIGRTKEEQQGKGAPVIGLPAWGLTQAPTFICGENPGINTSLQWIQACNCLVQYDPIID